MNWIKNKKGLVSGTVIGGILAIALTRYWYHGLSGQYKSGFPQETLFMVVLALLPGLGAYLGGRMDRK